MWLTNGKNGDENEFTCNIFEIEIFFFFFFRQLYCCNPCYSVISFIRIEKRRREKRKERIITFVHHLFLQG